MASLKVCGARAHPEDPGRDGLGSRWSAWCCRASGDKALDAVLPHGEARDLAGCKLSATGWCSAAVGSWWIRNVDFGLPKDRRADGETFGEHPIRLAAD